MRSSIARSAHSTARSNSPTSRETLRARRELADLATLEFLDQRVGPARGAGANQQRRELSDGRTRPGRQSVRSFGQRERFLEPPLLRADCAECIEGQREVLVNLQDLPQFGFSVLWPAGVSKTDRQVVAVQEIQRIQFKAPCHRFHGFRDATNRNR